MTKDDLALMAIRSFQWPLGDEPPEVHLDKAEWFDAARHVSIMEIDSTDDRQHFFYLGAKIVMAEQE